MTADFGDSSSGGRATRGMLRRANSLPHITVKRGTAAVSATLENALIEMSDSPSSPKSPLTCIVRESFLRNPIAPQHHTLHLNEFDELHHAKDRCCGTRTPTPPGLKQRCSTSSLCGDDSKKGSRMPSKEGAQSNSRAPSKEIPMSREEMNRKIKEEVDWFHTTRAINKSIRTPEETEALLTAARLRRANGESFPDVGRSRAGSKQSVASSKDEAEKREEVQPVPARRKNMADLWGAKPVAKAPTQEVQPAIERSTTSAMRGMAQCGQEESLRSRLLRRRSTIQ